MASFYGGPAGASFTLKKVFRNKEEMKQDLNQRWQSPIGVGDFVFIAYGLPGDSDDVFNTNQQVDLDNYNKSYNSTLWQKIYLESATDQADELTGVEKFFLSVDTNKDANYGLGYRLIVSMTGNTPKLSFEAALLDAGSDPYITIDNTKLDEPIVTLYLPRGQKIDYQGYEVLDAGSAPGVVWDEETDVNNPQLSFKLPQGQTIKLGEVTVTAAGTAPNVELDTTDINNPALNFELPEAQVIEVAEPTEVLDADQNPTVTLDDSDKSHPQLLFHLPQSQVMAQPEMVVLEPAAAPSVRDIGDVNTPKLEFSLPRGIRFEYGTELGEKTASSYPLSSNTLEPGDYYINSNTGFIYIVESKSGDTATMVYVATLQAPLPTVDATPKAAYEQDNDGNWIASEPEVVETYTDPDNQVGWSLLFNLPQFPNIELESSFVGASEQGSAQVAPAGENLLRFTFNIPKGSRIFAGSEVNRDTLTTAAVADAKLGDYYINTDTTNKASCGDAYELAAASTWVLKGNIRGPVGERLATVASYTLSDEAGDGVDGVVATDTLETTSPIVESLYGSTLNEYEMIAVNYVYNGDTTSYWYFQVDSVWNRVKLTGGMGQILKNEYVSPTDTSVNPAEVVYTVDYVNNLIVASPASSEKAIKTYTAEKIDEMVTQINQDIEDSTVVWGEISSLI